MEHDDQRVLSLARAYKSDSQQRPRREVEGARGLGFDYFARRTLAPALAPPGQVEHRDGDGLRRVNHLNWLALHTREARAQDFMPPHYLIQRAVQRPVVEVAGEAYGEGDVVGGAARLQLVEEPQPPLRERQRDSSAALDAFEFGRGVRSVVRTH